MLIKSIIKGFNKFIAEYVIISGCSDWDWDQLNKYLSQNVSCIWI